MTHRACNNRIWIKLYFYYMLEELDALASAFGAYTEELCAWMRSNRLKLNCEKTKCMWLCTKQRRKTLSASALHVGGATIQLTSGARNLGVFFDSHFDLKQHFSNVCRSCYFQLRQLRVVWRSLPPGVLRTLLHSFVWWRLDYCNSLMAGLSLCDIQRLQSVQNAAARLFGGVSKRGSVVPVLRDDLNWLPIKQRIDFNIGVLSFKAINGFAPQYLVEMFTPIAANFNQRSSLFIVNMAITSAEHLFFSCTIVILLTVSRGVSMCGHYKYPIVLIIILKSDLPRRFSFHYIKHEAF